MKSYSKIHPPRLQRLRHSREWRWDEQLDSQRQCTHDDEAINDRPRILVKYIIPKLIYLIPEQRKASLILEKTEGLCNLYSCYILILICV